MKAERIGSPILLTTYAAAVHLDSWFICTRNNLTTLFYINFKPCPAENHMFLVKIVGRRWLFLVTVYNQIKPSFGLSFNIYPCTYLSSYRHRAHNIQDEGIKKECSACTMQKIIGRISGNQTRARYTRAKSVAEFLKRGQHHVPYMHL